MTNLYRIINEATWKRAMHCMVFRNSVEPAFCVTFEADVTEVKRIKSSASLLAHNQITAPQFIRKSLHSS